MGNEETGRKYNIGVLIGDVYSEHPKELIQGVVTAAKNYNVNLEFFLGMKNINEYNAVASNGLNGNYEFQFNTIYDFSIYGDLDILIISYGTLCFFKDEQSKSAFFQKFMYIPKIVLEERVPNGAYLISDNYNGTCRAVEHLIEEHKLKKILYISGPKNNMDATERRQGYIDTMKRYGLPLEEEKMIIYGDYSQHIVADVVAFLERNPDAEAICAGNDAMAIGAYKACEILGLQVGVDIAIVGYDNCLAARSMDPAMTTVEQNGYDMGYHALVDAVAICEGKEVEPYLLPTRLVCRESCGCAVRRRTSDASLYKKEAILQNLQQIEHEMSLEIAGILESKNVLNSIESNVKEIVEYVVKEIYLADEIQPGNKHRVVLRSLTKKLLASEGLAYKNEMDFIDCVNHFLTLLASLDDKENKKVMYMQIISGMQNYLLHLQKRRQLESEVVASKKEWLSPLMLRSMNEHTASSQYVLLEAMIALQKLDVKKSFLFLFDKPVIHNERELWTAPDKIYLAAWHDEKNVQAIAHKDRQAFTRRNGISSLFGEGCHNYVAYSLSYETQQYGLLMCEMADFDISTIYVTSLQISTGLHVMLLNQKERETQKLLQETMKQLQEKNQVLEFVSFMDPLTGLLNRRGLIEKLLGNADSYVGKECTLVLLDLDHLKQINDTFGHNAGDHAIKTVANVLQQMINEDTYVGRIGGDEYIIVSFEKLDVEDIKRTFQEENQRSAEPYYIECSMGLVTFIYHKDIKIPDVMKQADDIMYEAKKHRRSSVVK